MQEKMYALSESLLFFSNQFTFINKKQVGRISLKISYNQSHDIKNIGAEIIPKQAIYLF